MTLEETFRNGVNVMDSLAANIEAEITSLLQWKDQVENDFNAMINELRAGKEHQVAGINDMIGRRRHDLSLLRQESK